MNTSLPIPDPEQLEHGSRLIQIIRDEIAAQGGKVSFARYMELALYAPGLGYYSAGAKKFGTDGDYVTAPEISPLFAGTLARQAAQVLVATGGNVLELGAGTGRLAAQVLLELQRLGALPQRYRILEVSAHLRSVQKETLAAGLPAELLAHVEWLEALPDTFTGLVIGNEVLDALPVHVLTWRETGIFERGVAWKDGQFVWQECLVTDSRLLRTTQGLGLPPGYISEVCPAASGLIASLAQMLEHGVLLFVDYGFPRCEYYHRQRASGTLMCHYRQLAHDDPFFHPGLQDITAHVDFTAVAETGVSHDLQLLGYTTQAQFLINCGITELLGAVSPADMTAYLPLASQAQKLLSPAEMGELFKVVALGKNMQPLLGFGRGDKRHTL
ncbi:MAG TPA: class I SAM-dependent methyltransferase [Methylophilaceae bacterium]|nr:class I SAM-dependent methyltransferase [Methylophilaceae bacterium]HQR59759.1 class I SAM-dependent methyltransferase [Methylophilaceae bacterium]